MRIELRDVARSFGNVAALRGVTLAIPQGARVGLVGPNGSGKSTLLRVVMGLVAGEGEVLLDGASPFERRDEVARRLAYVPQFAPQWGAAVADVVGAVASLRDLDPAAVATMARRLDLDLDALGPRSFRELSGGTKQKLLIAVALSTGASLFVLDEPTASLDAASRERFFALLDEVAGSATRLFCSHRIDEVRGLVDRVVVLRDGVVDYDGPTASYVEAPARATVTEARS